MQVVLILMLLNIRIVVSYDFEEKCDKNREVAELSRATMKAMDLLPVTEFNLIMTSNDLKVEEFCEDLTKNISERMKVHLELEGSNRTRQNSETMLCVFVMENENYFSSDFMQKLASNDFRFDGYFLMVVLDSGHLKASIIFKRFWALNIYNVNIVMKPTNEVIMTTFMPFKQSECDSIKPITINRYENDSWANQEIFPRKLSNLYKCKIKLSTFNYPPAIIVQKINGSEVISGHDVDLIRGISLLLNFTLDVKILTEPSAWGFLMENGTSGGVMKKIIDREADIAVGTYYLTETRAKFMSFCVYDSSRLILVIPLGVPLSPLEKLFSPFSKLTWLTLLLTFLGASFVIFIIKRQKKPIQDFVFGVNCGNPYLNMLDVLLNGSQKSFPARNFSRTLLMIFIAFCIVMRTSYQAAMFQFLKKEQRHADIQTIDELIEKKFDIYMYESFQELSRGLKIHDRFDAIKKHFQIIYT